MNAQIIKLKVLNPFLTCFNSVDNLHRQVSKIKGLKKRK